MASMLSSLLTGGSWTLTQIRDTKRNALKRNDHTLPDSTVRFGRVPKREKAKILAAMQKVNANSQERALSAELEDDGRLLTSIIRAHEETCDYTKEKVVPLLERARTQPVYTHCPSQLACPLNPPPQQCPENGTARIVDDFSERFWPAIRGVVEFAKRIPGFSMLAQDDQVTLLKAGVFEVLLVRLACMFDHHSNAMICLNGQVLRRDSVHSASNARFLLDSMFDFAERLNSLHLTDSEIGLFSAVVVIAADRPGIRNTELVQKIQKKLSDVLQKAVSVNHPENPGLYGDLMKKIPDLRTLNTLHSEKLLAYKMEPRNQSGGGAESFHSSAPASPYSSLIQADHWVQYTSMMTAATEEDWNESSPGPLSQHGGSTTGSEWSTTDSKDCPERFGSPRSVGSGMSVEEVKSPVRTASFSSTRSYDEGVCSGSDIGAHHMNHLHQLQQHQQQMKRCREVVLDHSSGDEYGSADSPIKVSGYPKMRRLDSPTDSGIESGKEQCGTVCTPTTSVCSSPHSSMEDKVKDVSDSECYETKHDIDDMPVLKRALQAPPLINTTMLMDEAYRHHKKFRAARKDAPDCPSSPSSVSGSMVQCKATLASAHSTLVKTLEQAPRYMNEQQLKRTDLIHNIILRNEGVSPQHHQVQTPRHQAEKISTMQMVSVPNTTDTYVYNVPQQQQPAVSKAAMCPPGYFIPNGATTVSMSGYPSNSWPFLAAPQSAGLVKTTFASPPQPNGHVQQQQSQRMHHVYEPHRLSPNSASPSSLVSSRVSPAPTGGLSLDSMRMARASPVSPVVMHQQVGPTDSQPLNLSIKSPPPPTVVKMES